MKKNGKIEFLRFAFAATIMVFHYPAFVNITETAQIGVEFFYIIMGAFMARKIVAESNKDIVDSTVKYILGKAISFYKYFLPAFVIKTFLTAIGENLGVLSVLDRLVISIPQLLFLNSLGFHPDTYAGAIYVPASWFLSSALICLFVIYPIAKQDWKRFVRIIAPIIVIFSASYLYMNFGTILVHYNFVNGVNVALLRTVMDLAIGCICFEVAQEIGVKVSNNKYVGWVEGILYVIVFLSIIKETPATIEVSILICLAVAVTLTISRMDKKSIFNNKFFYFLGRMSVPLYLLHCLVIQSMLLAYDDIQNWTMFLVFVGISITGAALWTIITGKIFDKKA